MPPIQYWFTGSAIAALIAFAAAVLGTGYGWYRAAVSEQDSAAQNADAVAQKQKIIRAKDLLGRALIAGRAIQAGGENGALTDDQLEQQTREWATHTQTVISAAYGDGEAALFLSNAGYHALDVAGSHSEKAKTILIFLYHRLDRISALISRSDSLTVRSDFDPAKFGNAG
jgi:hypothetical protein